MVAAAHKALDERGYGMSSVRFICGTQDVHRDARAEADGVPRHGGHDPLPELPGRERGRLRGHPRPEDVMISDRLVHASASSTASACARRCTTPTSTATWRTWSRSCRSTRTSGSGVIITDGVFSMDGDLAPLDEICRARPRSTTRWCSSTTATRAGSSARPAAACHEHFGVMGKIDIITTTLGKALGGASGGCVSGRKEIVELCRQKARPYLFSNAVPPPIAAVGHQGARHPERDHRAARQAGGRTRSSGARASSTPGSSSGTATARSCR